jgi:hypothetical protein
MTFIALSVAFSLLEFLNGGNSDKWIFSVGIMLILLAPLITAFGFMDFKRRKQLLNMEDDDLLAGLLASVDFDTFVLFTVITGVIIYSYTVISRFVSTEGAFYAEWLINDVET